METASEPTFTAQEAADAQTMLRQQLGLAPEVFSSEAFIGMISDEIEQLREAGEDDDAIAEHISGSTGKRVSADMVGRFYASPEARGHGRG